MILLFELASQRGQCAAPRFGPAMVAVVHCFQATASGNGDMSRSVDEARLLHCVDVLLLCERRAHHLVEKLHRLHSGAVQELRTVSSTVSVRQHVASEVHLALQISWLHQELQRTLRSQISPVAAMYS